jgi:acyl transferase domain-containing protein/acyl carrier protein
VTAEQKVGLDLSHWEIVANGAEPVRADTLERFADAFAECGLRRNNLYPCYGLAEATLVVSAGKKGTFPTVGMFKAHELERNEAVETFIPEENINTLVSIGKSHSDQNVLIVDSETRRACQEGRIGEIWVAGPSVAQGYWQRPEESEYTFHAHLQDGSGPFLRTGDLGFIQKGELFITGRLKDLIIIRGSNHYPQDIEKTVEASHAALRLNGSAAFSIEADGEERLVIVQEIERTALSSNLNEVVTAIREAIAIQHEIQVYAVILIKPGNLPKTSSGKVQRRGSRESYLDGSLSVVHAWKLDQDQDDPQSPQEVKDGDEMAQAIRREEQQESEQASATAPGVSATEIQDWLVTHVAQALKINAKRIDRRAPFAQYGMDSAQAISLSADLEDWLGRSIVPTVVYDYPTIETLAYYLSGEELPREEQQAAPEQRVETDAVAIIGLGCRFPGANNSEEFWQMLRNGVDGISEVPPTRWNVDTYYDPMPATPGKMNTRWGGFLKDIDQFEPSFFSISPREAISMDPQQRLLLEVAWETLEYAGIAAQKIAGSQTGVFIGISSDDYSRQQYKNPRQIDAYAGTGNAHSIAANRLSYALDLRGPSIAMDTACSSSLLAVHQACQSLRNGECQLALAGGVNIILTPDLTITFSQARMMSSDGHCKTFDESADGYVRGEGCGLVLLKPLADAQRDGDNVLAIIRGSAVNQDGRSNGITAPNGPSQEAVIKQALQNARVTPEQISFVETHGSSTPLGDPIEVAALKAVLMQQRTSDQPCILGAVKTNVGHLESAAGIAGLLKTVLSLHKGEIAPNLNFKKLNPHIALEGTTFVLPTQVQPWPERERRLAGVSAFGFGGTNVHMIVEAAPETKKVVNEIERSQHLLTLSARSEQALRALAKRYQTQLSQTRDMPSVADICYTANTGRTHFPHRLAISAGSTLQLRERLATFSAGKANTGMQSGYVSSQTESKLAFLFTGQGSQYTGMARQLYETQPTFRRTLDRCDEILRAYLEQPLLSVIYPDAGVSSPLNETMYTQPALFALEYALAELWRSWGIEPDIVLGHSIGEYVAACIAGAFSLEDGLKLIAARGRLMQELPERGSMLVAFAEPARLASLLEAYRGQVAVAVINGPNNTVLSGNHAALQSIIQHLGTEGIETHAMTVSHAFHSPLMEPMLESFKQIAQEIQFKPLQLPLVCNLNGQLLSVGETMDAEYWQQQTRGTVQFAAGMQTLAQVGCDIFLEVGPSATLVNMGKRSLVNNSGTWLVSLRQEQNDWQVLLNSVATLYVHGIDLNWSGFDKDYQRQHLALPSYPFERQSYWFETTAQAEGTEQTEQKASRTAGESNTSQQAHTTHGLQRHPLLDTYVAVVHPAHIHVWESALEQQRLPYLNDHRIQGAIALPISAYVEMAQAATTEAFGTGKHVLKEIELKKLLLLPEKGSQKVQVILSSDSNEQVSFHIYSHVADAAPSQDWTLHATGKIEHV